MRSLHSTVLSTSETDHTHHEITNCHLRSPLNKYSVVNSNDKRTKRSFSRLTYNIDNWDANDALKTIAK